MNYEKRSANGFDSRSFRLDRMRYLLGLLGNPHQQLKVLHVAGTKGKGTVSTLLAACLSANGWKTGLYTSPHLLRLEERFQIDGQIATEQHLANLTSIIRRVLPEFEKKIRSQPTFFEFTTAIAFLHFATQEVDFAVLEVGMGGRLDSTNVCSPLISVITSISLDHQKQLGNTIPEIAAEKAGIIKSNTPVVTSVVDPGARQVIEARCAERNAPLTAADSDYSFAWTPAPRGQVTHVRPCVANVDYLPADERLSHFGQLSFDTPLMGRHQAENVAAAVATLDLFSRAVTRLDQDSIQATIASTSVPARMDTISYQPPQIIDTAHNPASIQAAIKAVEQHFPGKSIITVFSSSLDKDYRAMLQMLVNGCSVVVCTAFMNNPRSVPSGDLLELARNILSESNERCELHAAPTPLDAWHRGCQLQTSENVMLATGSFFLAAELLAGLESGPPEWSVGGHRSAIRSKSN